MQEERRLTTDRWFGDIEDRRAHLRETFEYVDENNPTEETLIEWVLETTNGETEDGVRRRLRFLESVEFLQGDNGEYRLTERSRNYLETDDPAVLFEGLRSKDHRSPYRRNGTHINANPVSC